MTWKIIDRYYSVIKQILFLGIANIVPTIIAAGFWFYIASLLGDENYGEITYYLTIGSIATGIAMVGSPVTLNVYAAKGERILPTLSTLVFTLSAIGGITVYFIFHNPSLSVYIFGYVILALISAEFLGRKLFKTYMKITILQKILMVILGIGCYYWIGVDGVILGIAFSFLPFCVLYYKEFKENKIDFKNLKPKKKFILNNYLLQFSRMFSASLDKLVIAPIFGFAILGNYALGIQFYMVFLIIPSIIFQYILPQDASGNRSIVLKKITILTSVGISILGIIVSPIIVENFFPEFAEAIIIVQIISLAVIPGTINYMYISKFLGTLQNKIILMSSCIFLVSIVSGMIILGGLYDVYGIAIAFVIAKSMESIFLTIANKHYNI